MHVYKPTCIPVQDFWFSVTVRNKITVFRNVTPCRLVDT